MQIRKTVPLAAFVAALLGICGCCYQSRNLDLCRPDPCQMPPTEPGVGISQLHRSDPCLDASCDNRSAEFLSPLDLDEAALTAGNFLPLTLEQCVQQALATSNVMRDLGGTIIRAPQATPSRLDPALVFSDPRSGEEAALSAFDANFFLNSNFEDNARALNNQFFGNQGFFRQDLWVTQTGFNKRSATGGQYSVRNVTIKDNNNQLSNRLGSRSWETYFEGEVRQPLMQGAGTQFNRIAGPGALPGQYNGVLLARVRTDISLVDFERSVRDLVAEVENAYWDLYFSYRDLEAKIQARDIARQTWDFYLSRRADVNGGEIAQAEEQFHRFQSDVLDALQGRPLDGTRTNNGSPGGTFRGQGGIRVAERKLRLLAGMPINDGRLIQPVDSPAVAPVRFDWQNAISTALDRREELRRQRWVVKQRELELVASENFLRPQLDVVARARARGFGATLFDDAVRSLYRDDLTEYQLGLEYNVPVGFRRANAGVRNAELALSREAELLREQERIVHFGLSNAIGEARRAWDNMQLQKKRLDAIVQQLNIIATKREKGDNSEIDIELETHRRLLDARLRYHQAQIEYQVALRNVHFEQGTLLDFNGIRLSESISPVMAIEQAGTRQANQDESIQPRHRDPVIAAGDEDTSAGFDAELPHDVQPVDGSGFGPGSDYQWLAPASPIPQPAGGTSSLLSDQPPPAAGPPATGNLSDQ